MRFYIPGVATVKEKKSKREEDAEDGDAEEDGEDVEEETNAANMFYDTLMERAEIGEVAGDTVATFLDVLHLTPRFVIRCEPTQHELITLQGSFRYRHVRKVFPVAWKDVRLQDPIRVNEEIHATSETR